MNRFVTDTTLVYTSIFCGLDDCYNMFLASFPSFSVYHSNRIFIRFNYAFSNFSWLLLYLKLKSIVHMFFQIVHIWLPFFFSTRLTLSQLLWLICFLQRLQEYFCLIQGSLTPRTHWAATSVMHKVSLLSSYARCRFDLLFANRTWKDWLLMNLKDRSRGGLQLPSVFLTILVPL